MKFVLFVEGHTEKQALANFLKRWLDPRLDSHIGFQVVRLEKPYLEKRNTRKR